TNINLTLRRAQNPQSKTSIIGLFTQGNHRQNRSLKAVVSHDSQYANRRTPTESSGKTAARLLLPPRCFDRRLEVQTKRTPGLPEISRTKIEKHGPAILSPDDSILRGRDRRQNPSNSETNQRASSAEIWIPRRCQTH